MNTRSGTETGSTCSGHTLGAKRHVCTDRHRARKRGFNDRMITVEGSNMGDEIGGWADNGLRTSRLVVQTQLGDEQAQCRWRVNTHSRHCIEAWEQ